ncbi:hypothetical protein F4679DRAFT_198819 [Xylaria curta]|nr:hypothetical protein F4679DRAFT_198819 [Xylaria curta]
MGTPAVCKNFPRGFPVLRLPFTLYIYSGSLDALLMPSSAPPFHSLFFSTKTFPPHRPQNSHACLPSSFEPALRGFILTSPLPTMSDTPTENESPARSPSPTTTEPKMTNTTPFGRKVKRPPCPATALPTWAQEALHDDGKLSQPWKTVYGLPEDDITFNEGQDLVELYLQRKDDEHGTVVIAQDEGSIAA